MNMSDLIYWIWLTTRKGVGAVAVLRLLDAFITPRQVYYAQEEDYQAVEGITPHAVKMLLNKSLDEANEILGRCDQLNIQLMTIQDANYPDRLRQIDDPPPLLYYKGKPLHLDDQVVIGMVGSRDPTDYGIRNGGKLALEIARGGGLVVSGLAQGIDSAALRGALMGGGSVVSVLAGGLDEIYPRENRFLAQDVAAVGMLLSEYPPGTPHRGMHFPIRNRIISGLSLGVIAVECNIQSGTMITIRRALDQNRDVFALPGNVDAPLSRGPNYLIRQGAQIITCGEDVLEEYRSRYPTRIPEVQPLEAEVLQARIEDLANDTTREGIAPPPKAKSKPAQEEPPTQTAPPREFVPAAIQRDRFTDDELAILRTLGEKSATADDLVEATQIPTRRILSSLTMLQVRGQIEEEPGKRFVALVELEQI